MALEGPAYSSGALGAGIGAGIGGVLGGRSEQSAYGFGSSQASSFEQGGSSSLSDAWSRVYGSEASAQDIERAREANELQYKLWRENADFNKSEAQLSREWQEYMSNTSYQRAVKDMIAAGLNPVLAAMNSGASTPTGATASSAATTAHKANTYADQESGSHSEGSSYNVGGSQQTGININMSSGKSQSLIHDLGDGLKGAVQSLTNGFKGGGSGSRF